MTELTDPRLVVPPLPPFHIPRTRLISGLEDARGSPLVLLSAGPGAGKTVLLSDWARQWSGPVAWLTVTSAENEPHRFWRLFLSAARGSDAAESLMLPALWGADATALSEPRATGSPSSPASPLTLVIDDAHVLSHPRILDGLDQVARGLHPGLRLVLAARSDPLLPLHRYRLAGQMSELRATDLAMTGSEARALLAAYGVTLPDAMLDVLTTRTEGWTAGIRLSALRMAGTENPADFVADFAVDQGSIGEYLIREVLAQQPRRARQLLVQTGFLDEVTGSLADAITGANGSADILAELARSNSFVTPLDRAQTRFRYHQLLAEILQHLLQQKTPQLAPSLYRRAATWYERHGDLGRSLKFAAMAGDGARVASILARDGLAWTYVHRHDTLDCDTLLGVMQAGPLLADESAAAEERTARRALAALSADGRTAAAELKNLRALQPTLTDFGLLATADLAELILAEKAGDAGAADAASARLLDAGTQDQNRRVPGIRACILLARARTQFWDGRHDAVEGLLQDALSAAKSESDRTRAVELEVIGFVALVHAYTSRNHHADDAIGQARRLQHSDASLSAPPALELATAFRAFTRGEFATMAHAIQRAGSSNMAEWDPAIAALLIVARAQMLAGRGQYTQARIALQTAPELPPGTPSVLVAQRDMIRACVETALGRPRAALRLLATYRKTPFDLSIAVPCARAYLALGDLASAHGSVRRALTAENSQLGRYLLIEALLCDAEIANAQHDPARAIELLDRALGIADGDIALPFVRTSSTFAPLLGRHPTVAARWPSGGTGDASTSLVQAETSAAASFPERLTDRERMVLRLLATSMSTAEIADELCLSINTIKTHMSGIYRKLAARRRREAVLRAREFELL